MILSVADRFSFTLEEIEGMTMRKLRFWYGGARRLYEQDAKGITDAE